MQWHIKRFKELSNRALYQILQLRIDVFVVEQNCTYSDLDGLDSNEDAFHLYAEENNQVIAYLRVLPPHLVYANKSCFGRVVTHQQHRHKKLGHQLVKRALNLIESQWPQSICHISAQSHLQAFYEQHGFKVVGEPYLEDDIPHVGMEK